MTEENKIIEKPSCVVCLLPAGKRSRRHAWIICSHDHIKFIHSACIKSVSHSAICNDCKYYMSTAWPYVNEQKPELISADDYENNQELKNKKEEISKILTGNKHESIFKFLRKKMMEKIEQERISLDLGDIQMSFAFHEVYFKPFSGKEEEYKNLCRRVKNEILDNQPEEIIKAFKNISSPR
jgi:hypothetical protein